MKAWEDHQRKEGMHFDPLPFLTRTLADNDAIRQACQPRLRQGGPRCRCRR
jgi:hypothetical protein